MKTAHALILTVAFLILVPALSPAEVKVTLKNGRSFIADFCREAKGKMVCDVRGGTMEVPRSDVAGIREVHVQRESFSIEEEPEPEASAEEKRAPETPQAEKKEAPSKPGEGRLITGLTPEQTKRIDAISARKAVLKPQREELIREREQIHEDVKNAGVVRTQEQIDAIADRIIDLEARINSFNKEIEDLNDEEDALIAGSRKKQ